MSKKRRNKPIGTAFKSIELLTRDDTILSFSTLSSKHTNAGYRKQYLEKMTELFSLDELSEKWKSNKLVVCGFLISNKVSPFNKRRNKLEEEIDTLIGEIPIKEIRKRFQYAIETYNLDSFLRHYQITNKDFLNCLSLFGGNYILNKEVSNKIDVPESFSLLKGIEEKESEKNMTVDLVYNVDKHGNVFSLKSVITETNTTKVPVKQRENKIINPISIIQFLTLSEAERKASLKYLDKALNIENLEKRLGIPSTMQLRKLKIRHMIFDFKKKEKLKEAFQKLKTFEDCQKLAFDIIKNKQYSKYNLEENTFIDFADKYLGITYSKRKKCWIQENWETFCDKIIKEAINCYKRNSRVTNLTQQEVLDFEKVHRRIIPNDELTGIVRQVIQDLYKEGLPWISIFDFKTEIEKNNFELDSNERIINLIDDLIKKGSFKNDNFTLKKVELENTVLSNDSSYRWEFVTLRSIPVHYRPSFKEIVDNTKVEEKKHEPVVVTKPVVKEEIKKEEKKPEPVVVKKEIKKEEPLNFDKLEEKIEEKLAQQKAIVVSPPQPSIPISSFLNNINLDITFNESNINAVTGYIKGKLKEIGSGSVCITISKS